MARYASWDEYKKAKKKDTNAAPATGAASAPAAGGTSAMSLDDFKLRWEQHRAERDNSAPLSLDNAKSAREKREANLNQDAKPQLIFGKAQELNKPANLNQGKEIASKTAQYGPMHAGTISSRPTSSTLAASKAEAQQPIAQESEEKKRQSLLKDNMRIVPSTKVGPLQENEQYGDAYSVNVLKSFEEYLAEQNEMADHFQLHGANAPEVERTPAPTQAQLDELEGRAKRMRGQMQPYDISGAPSMSVEEYERSQETLKNKVAPPRKKVGQGEQTVEKQILQEGKKVGAGSSAVQLPEDVRVPDDFTVREEGNVWDTFDWESVNRRSWADIEKEALDRAFIDQMDQMPEYDMLAAEGAQGKYNVLRLAKMGLEDMQEVRLSDSDRAFYLYAPDEIKKKYNAVYAQFGADRAREFIAQYQDEYNMQAAQARLDRIENAPASIKWLLEGATAAESGIKRTAAGWGQAIDYVLGNTWAHPVEVSTYTAQQLKQILNDTSGWRLFGKEGWGWKKILFDTIETTSAQAPQMLLGAAGAGSFATLGQMAVSVYGNTYNEAMHEYGDVNIATNLAFWSAAIEVATEKIGGVGFLSGGTWTEEALGTWINACDNAFARYALNMGSNILGESTEEAISGILDPYVDAFVRWDQMTDEEKANVGVDWEEVLYEAFMGGVSGGLMGGPSTTVQLFNEVSAQSDAEQMGKAGLHPDTFREAYFDETQEAAPEWAYNAYKSGMVEFMRRMGQSGRSIESVEAEYGTLTGEMEQAWRLGHQDYLEGNDVLKFVESQGVTVTHDEQKMEDVRPPMQTRSEISETAIEDETQAAPAQEEETRRQNGENLRALMDKVQAELRDTAYQYGNSGLSLEALEESGPITDEMRDAFEQGRRDANNQSMAQAQNEARQAEAAQASSGAPKIETRRETPEFREAAVEDSTQNVEKAEPAAPQIREQAAEIAAATLADETKTPEERHATFREAMITAGEGGDVDAKADAVIAAVTGETMTAEQQDAIAQSDTALEFAQNVAEALTEQRDTAYQYGKAGLGLENLEAMAGEVTDEQRTAWERGRAEAQAQTQKRAAQLRANGEQGAQPGRRGVTREITQEEADRNGVRTLDGRHLSPKQRAARNAVDVLGRATGINFVLYESTVDETGEHVGKNGWYDNKTQSAYIDISSGRNGEQSMLRTAAHEITHFIQNWAPENFDALRDFLVSYYNGKGADVLNGLVADEIDTAAQLGREIDEVEAVQEVTANAMERMMEDPDAIRGLAKENTGLFVRMKMWIDSFLHRVRAAIQGLGQGEEASRILWEDMEAVRRAQRLWYDALSDAGDNLRGRILEEEENQTEQIRAEADPGTDFILVPGTDFELVDYRRPERNPKPAATRIMKPKALSIRPTNEIALREQRMAAQQESAPQEPARKTSKAFDKLLAKWAENEWVNQPLDGSERADAFTEFAQKWYNAGRDGIRKTDVEQGDAEAEYPVFLQDEFYNQGVKEAQTALKRKTARKKKGAANVQEAQVHNDGSVSQPGQDGQGAVRLLDEVPAENVAEPGGEGRVLGEPEERGGDVGPGVRELDSSGVRGLRGSGGTEANDDGNAAGTGNLSEESADSLTVEEAVEKKTAETQAPAQNYHFDKLDLPSGEKSRFQANLEAIRTAKQIAAENRTATPEEQEILAKFVGWGGLANAFNETKKEWQKEYKQLKAALTEDEWNAGMQSTQNAHYTETSVIQAMYDALRGWGFKGGRMLEPSAGTGNFIGAMPTDMAQTVSGWRAVELDKLTGLILTELYPQARVEVKGFQDTKIPDNSIDVAIGNVPFSPTAPYDRRYKDTPVNNLHNYFFAKAIDKVRPGGLVYFITSSFTMDSDKSNFRQYMDERADFKGAVRLPNNAFKGNANTSVVTDILVFQKRAPGARNLSEPFIRTSYHYIYDENGRYTDSVRVNQYFTDHPDMVLGTLSNNGSMYAKANKEEKEMTVESNGKPLAPQIREALGKLDVHMTYERTVNPEVAQEAAIRASRRTKENGYEIKDGKVYQNIDGELQEVQMEAKDKKRLAGILELRDAGRGLIEAQKMGKSDAEIAQAQKDLNKLYDAFVKKYGYLHTKDNQKTMGADPDRQFINALENWDADEKKATKADIFSRRVYQRVSRPESAQTVAEAILICQNETGGKLDLARVAKLLGISKSEAREQMLEKRQAFLDPDGNLVARDEYLSGYVRAKLKTARELAEDDDRYKANVEELEKVVPRDKTAEEITIHMGESWIPAEVYESFINKKLSLWGYRDKKLTIVREVSGHWSLSMTNSKLQKDAKRRSTNMGAGGVSYLEMFEANMNGKQIVVKEPGSKGKTVDREATALVQKAQEDMKKEFREWLFKDKEQANELLKLYNDTYRSYVSRDFDGSAFTVNGLDPKMNLRDYQKRAAQRVIQQGGNILLAHCVGAGKTATMAATAMKMRELGLVKKPMFVVPKAVCAQWGVEFQKFFPAARVLTATAEDFQKANRREFINRIATNDFDAVIVSYEQFGRIEMSKDRQVEFINRQLDQARKAMAEAKKVQGGEGRSVKNMAKSIATLEARLKKITDSVKDVDNIDFEDLGVDGLFVDEAHNFKNLFYTSGMSVAGLGNPQGSQRSADLYMKTQYMQELNGGRGVVFATATPVMNSMVEMFTMQRYLQPELLKRYGIDTFDGWASMFGQIVTNITAGPAGDFRAEKSFGSFNNIAELERMFRTNADVMTQLPDTVKLPKVRGGKHTIVECDPTPFQREFIKHLGDRAGALTGKQPIMENNRHPELLSGIEDPENDNMLVITSDGRKVALSQRLIDPKLDWGAESKIYKCADNVWKEYQDDADNLGTQLIFCDLGVPKGGTATESSEEETDENGKKKKKTKAEREAEERGAANIAAEEAASNDVYNEIKRALIERGIPEKEIAFIHEFNSDEAKKLLSKKMDSGAIRVLIGSTVKMGVGLNVQKRICAMHHLDCPWRPGDLEQRNGRGIRNGNMHDEIGIYEYVTVETFDTRLWGKIRDKSFFINQAMNGNENTNDIPGDDMGMSAAETAAAASGNPLIMEQIKNQQEIEKLEALKAGVEKEAQGKRQQAQYARQRAEVLEHDLPLVREDAKTAEAHDVSGEAFTIEIGGKTITDRKTAGEELIKATQHQYVAKANAMLKDSVYERRATVNDKITKIGTFAGFDLVADTNLRAGVEGKLIWSTKINEQSAEGTIRSITNRLKATTQAAEALPKQISELNKQAESLEKAAEMSFDQQKQLDALKLRNMEIERTLNPEGQTNFIDAEEEETQSSERKPGLKSDRQLLAEAMESVAANDQEREALLKYQSRVERLDTLNDELNEINAQIKEKSFATGPRDKAGLAKLQAKKQLLTNTITREDSALLRLQRSELLRNILSSEKKKAAQKARKAADERLAQYKERTVREMAEMRQKALDRYAKRNETVSKNELKEKIAGKVETLRKWLEEPNQKKYIPTPAQDSIIRLLNAIDFTSKRALAGGAPTKADERLAVAMERLSDMLDKAKPQANMDEETLVDSVFGAYADLPQDFVDSMKQLTREIREATSKALDKGGFTVNAMNSEQLTELNRLLNTFFHILKTMGKTMQVGLYDNVRQMTSDSLMYFHDLGEQKTQMALTKALVYNHTTPVFFFKRLGPVGQAIWEGIKKGDRTFAQHIEEINKFNETGAKPDEIGAWRKQIIEVELEDGSNLRMPATYAMELLALSKRRQAMGHILGKGIMAKPFANGDDYGHTMTQNDLTKIFAELSDRQRKVVQQYQKFMGEKGGDWGNYVSRRRFGADQYTEGENYWPIKSDPEGRGVDPTQSDNDKQSLYRLLNMGFTKPLVKGANNRILIGDFFDTFADHMTEMAQYNAYALTVLDTVKWLNSKEDYKRPNQAGTTVSSVYTFMRKALGRGAQQYIIQFIKDLSGAQAYGMNEQTSAKLLRLRNRGAVAANLRVIALQPMAMFRGMMKLNARDMGLGLVHNITPAKIKSNIEEMRKYSGTALMKKFGFYDANSSRSVRELIAPEGSKAKRNANKVLDWLMSGAETADTLTWSLLWEATKQRIQKQHPGVDVKSQQFLELAGDMFDDLVYSTQVVDMVTTRSQYMRNGSDLHKLFSSFMMEPVLTYNQLLDTIMTLRDDERKMGHQAAMKKNMPHIGRTAVVYAVTAAMTALTEAFVDAMRDDDDYETFIEKLRQAYMGNFIDDLSPLNKIPIASQLWDGGKSILALLGVDTYGYGSGNPIQDAIDSATKAITVWQKYLKGGGYTAYGVLYNTAKIPQTIGGVPIASMMRDGVSLWNTLGVGLIPEATRVQTYKTSDSVAGDAFVSAYASGDTVRMRHLTEEMGYNDVDAAKTITAATKRAYKAGRMKEENAIDLLMEYGGAESKNEAQLTVRKWETQAETGNSSAGDYARVYSLIDNWDGAELKKEIKELMALGKEKGNIASSITSHYKSQFLAASGSEKAELKQHLIAAFELLGYSRADAMKKINKWEE